MVVEIITDPRQLREGDVMIGPIHGPTGFGIGLGQLALATAEPGLVWRQGVEEWWRKRHAGIVTRRASPSFELRATGATGVGPMLVQAMAGGVEEIELTHSQWTSEYTYLRPRYAPPSDPYRVGLEFRGQGMRVAAAAVSFIGTPYDFLTYGAIPLYRRGIRTERIKHIISDTDTMMCSRTVDASMEVAGFHLFDDGRMRGDVTPSELYRQIVRLGYVARSDLSGVTW